MKSNELSLRILIVCAIYALSGVFTASANGLVGNEPPQYERSVAKALYARPDSIPFPEDNPYTRAKEVLVKKLFFDPRLSGSRAISCASCHSPAFSWGMDCRLVSVMAPSR